MDDGVSMDEEKIKQVFTIQPKQTEGIGIVNTEQQVKRLYGTGLEINRNRKLARLLCSPSPCRSQLFRIENDTFLCGK